MSTFAVIEFNNFYVNCERAFNPQLEQQALAILSHQTGCVVALSQEAEKSGIKIGDSYFKCQPQCERHGVQLLVSNYELYSDMSARIHACLQTFCPNLEMPALDEVHLRLDTLQYFDLQKYFAIMQKDIKTSLGIPISIGYAPTKILAKLANRLSKMSCTASNPAKIISLCNPNQRLEVLAQVPVEEVWGIDCRTALQLKKLAILTAKDLKDADPKLLRRKFSLQVEKIALELNGNVCLTTSDLFLPKKQITSDCTFTQPIITLEALQEIISTYTARACLELQHQNSAATGMYVYLNTDTTTAHFTQPTADTNIMIAHAKQSLQKIYQYGAHYQKTGIVLMDIMPLPVATLPYSHMSHELKPRFFSTLQTKTMKPLKQKIPRRYTTHWQEVPIVSCNH